MVRAGRWRWALLLLAISGSLRAGDAEAPVRPNVLDRPLESPREAALPAPRQPGSPILQTPVDPPVGFTGPSGVLPRDGQEDPHFVPVEDRWRLGFPAWD